jgi:chromate reductase
MERLKIAGLSGSLRKGSFNTMLLKASMELLPEQLDMEIFSYEDLPLYNADLDLPAAQQRPRSVTRFREDLSSVAGLLIVSPEYNYSIPGG